MSKGRQVFVILVCSAMALLGGWYSAHRSSVHESGDHFLSDREKALSHSALRSGAPALNRTNVESGQRVLSPEDGELFWESAILAGLDESLPAQQVRHYEEVVMVQARRDPEATFDALARAYERRQGAERSAERAAILLFGAQLPGQAGRVAALARRELDREVRTPGPDAPYDERMSTSEEEAALVAAHAALLAGADSEEAVARVTVEALSRQKSPFVCAGILRQTKDLRPSAWRRLGEALLQEGLEEAYHVWKGMG